MLVDDGIELGCHFFVGHIPGCIFPTAIFFASGYGKAVGGCVHLMLSKPLFTGKSPGGYVLSIRSNRSHLTVNQLYLQATKRLTNATKGRAGFGFGIGKLIHNSVFYD